MKFKSLLLVCCFVMAPSLYAANMHLHPKASNETTQSTAKKALTPGYCEIEIINDSYDDVTVHGTFDDGSYVNFNVYSFEAPHYISLYYYGYCHESMYVDIYTPFYKIYSNYTRPGSTINIVPYLDKQAKARISFK